MADDQWQDQRLAVVVLAGPPCSGKSTAGVWLAGRLSGIHLELDSLLSLILPHSDRCLQDRLLAYDIAARAVRPILDRNLSAILDCTYSRRQVRRGLVDNLNSNDPLVVIEFCITPDAALRRFDQRRQHPATDLSAELAVQLVDAYPYGRASQTVNGEATPEEIQDQLAQILGRDQDLDREQWVEAGL